MARYDHLPIWKDAVALTAWMQTILGLHATRNLRLPKFAPGEFVPRYHKYALSRLLCSLRRMRRPHVLVLERGYLKTGFKRRVFHSLWWPALQAVTSPSFRPFDEINPHPQPLSQRARGAQGTDHVC